MVNGKKKGKNGELEVVRLCRAQGYEARRSAQYCGNNEDGTADVVGLPGIHIEVKRVEHLNLDDALAQASRDAKKTTGSIPAVFHRKNGTGWKVTMGADDWSGSTGNGKREENHECCRYQKAGSQNQEALHRMPMGKPKGVPAL